MEWDNLNVLTTSIHGSNVVNSIGGIMIQEIKPATDVDNVIPKDVFLFTKETTQDP